MVPADHFERQRERPDETLLPFLKSSSVNPVHRLGIWLNLRVALR